MRIRIKLKKKLFIYAAVIFVIALVVLRLVQKNNGKTDGEDKSGYIPVRVTEVVPKKVEWGTSVVGILKPDKGVDILSESSGKVTGIYFNIGEYAQNGKILAKLDDEYKKYDLIRAEAQYRSAKADWEKSELDLKRYKQLLEEKGISEYDYENIRLKRDVSKANYLTAESAYKTAQRQFDDTEIKAPFDGLVSAKMIEIGDMVSVGMPAARVIDIRTIKLDVEVAEKDVVSIKTGNTVKIFIDVYPDDEFTGKVTAVSPEAEINTKTFKVEIKITNTDDYVLKPGMIAKGKIITEISENAILLQQEAIFESGGENYIFLNNDGSAKKKVIAAGRIYNNLVEITDGLLPNDSVIISGGEFLSDGTKLIIQE